MSLTILNKAVLTDKALAAYNKISSGGVLGSYSLDPKLQCVAVVFGSNFLQQGSAYFTRFHMVWPDKLFELGLLPENYLSVGYESTWGIFGDVYYVDCDLESLQEKCPELFPSSTLEYIDDDGNSIELWGDRVECSCDSPAMCRCNWTDIYVDGGSLLQRRYQVYFGKDPSNPKCSCTDESIHDLIRE